MILNKSHLSICLFSDNFLACLLGSTNVLFKTILLVKSTSPQGSQDEINRVVLSEERLRETKGKHIEPQDLQMCGRQVPRIINA